MPVSGAEGGELARRRLGAVAAVVAGDEGEAVEDAGALEVGAGRGLGCRWWRARGSCRRRSAGRGAGRAASTSICWVAAVVVRISGAAAPPRARGGPRASPSTTTSIVPAIIGLVGAKRRASRSKSSRRGERRDPRRVAGRRGRGSARRTRPTRWRGSRRACRPCRRRGRGWSAARARSLGLPCLRRYPSGRLGATAASLQEELVRASGRPSGPRPGPPRRRLDATRPWRSAAGFPRPVEAEHRDEAARGAPGHRTLAGGLPPQPAGLTSRARARHAARLAPALTKSQRPPERLPGPAGAFVSRALSNDATNRRSPPCNL